MDYLQSRHGKTLYAAEFISAVEEADKNGDGLINIPELILVIESMQSLKKENTGLKKYLGIAAAVLLLVLVAIFGLVFAVVALTKEISTGDTDNPNALVSKTTGHIVDTHPSDGGGIYLDMGSFTEPLNITFPGFDETLECVGHVSAASIDKAYTKFTTGGSSMTIRYVDYSRDTQPVVYTHIPGTNVEVSGFGANGDAGLAAMEATQAIKDTQAQFGSEPANRKLLGRALADVMVGGKDGAYVAAAVEEEQRARNNGPAASGQLVSDKNGSAGRNKRNRRRLEVEEFMLETVDDYMKSFATQENGIAFTKDIEISDEYYFVCLATGATATN